MSHSQSTETYMILPEILGEKMDKKDLLKNIFAVDGEPGHTR